MYRRPFLQLMRRFLISVVLILLVSAVLPLCKAYSESPGMTSPERSNTAKADDQDIHSIIPLQKEFNTRTDWYAVAYYGTSTLDGMSKDGPSRLCFRKGREGKDEGCYVAEKDLVPGYTYKFFEVLELKPIPFFKHSQPHKILLFSARFSGGGSDWLDLITLWSYTRKTDSFIQITPTDKSKAIALNSQDTYRLFNVNVNGLKKIIVAGHFIWQEDEGHFGNHFYHIAIHVYRPGKGLVLLGKYKTKKKYLGEDIYGQADLLFNAEMKNIRKFVRQKLK